MFVNQRGKQLSRQGLYKIVQRHARSAGLQDRMSPHTLATPSPPTSSPAAATCARSRRCWATPTSRRPRSTPTSRTTACATSTSRPILGRRSSRRSICRPRPAPKPRSRLRSIPAVGIAHFDDAPSREVRGRSPQRLAGRPWERPPAATVSACEGSRSRAGGWSTPAHEHAAEEEIFYVLAGRGLSWQAERTTEVGAGRLHRLPPRAGAHTLHALEDLEVLAFGPRIDERERSLSPAGAIARRHRLFRIRPQQRATARPSSSSVRSNSARPTFPLRASAPPRSSMSIDVQPDRWDRPRIASTRRDLGDAAGTRDTGLGHVEVDPGQQATPQHCHSMEEEVFVVLAGEGVLLLGDEEVPVRQGP